MWSKLASRYRQRLQAFCQSNFSCPTKKTDLFLTQVSFNLAKTWTVFLPAPWTSWSKTWAGGYLWTQTRILSPNLCYFVGNSRFKRFLEGFWQKKVFLGDKIAQSLFFGGQKCPITLIARVNYGKPYIFAGQRKGLWEGDVLLDDLVQVVIT